MTDQPRSNIEVKARYPDLWRAREVCQRLGARFQGILDQIDTYFATDQGRLKLRQITEQSAEDRRDRHFCSSPVEQTFLSASDGGTRVSENPLAQQRAELISYVRPNDATARKSLYTVAPVADPSAELERLAKQSCTLCTVRKRRELYLWHNVRIHLDEVDGLGSFIEFEGVVSPDADEQLSRQRVEQLVSEFTIPTANQVGVSYSDLLMAMS